MLLKLPLCPYCGARFFYRQVNRTKKDGTGVCPHCGGIYEIVYKKQRRTLFAAAAGVAVGCDVGLLWLAEGIGLLPLYLLTLAVVIAALILVPYVVRYQKRDRAARRKERMEKPQANRK